MMNIKAIETEYAGCRFRSRLEARYAKFFDALGLHWQYEREGFDLGDRLWYLPDFWLVEQQCWIEVKPSLASVLDVEKKKANKLSVMSGFPVYMVFGDLCSITTDEAKNPPAHMTYDAITGKQIGLVGELWSEGGMLGWFPDYPTSYSGGYDFGECSRCGAIVIGHFCSQASSINHSHTCGEISLQRPVENNSTRIAAAFRVARSARFEFGR